MKKRIGLIDVDDTNFPNLALMKISAYHKAKGDEVEFVYFLKSYDIVFQSKVFTYKPDSNQAITAKRIIKGGAGYKLYRTILSEKIEHLMPDYSLYECKYALGFLTRGCPNKCKHCIMPQKEGDIRPHSDISEFLGSNKKVVLLDNNVLASNHGLKQIEKMIDLKLKVDFNQGLDAMIIAENPDIAKLLSRVKWSPYLRMACDNDNQIPYIEKATTLLRKYNCTPKNYFIYLLVKDVDKALKIARRMKELKLDPFAQPYRDFKNNIEPTKEQKEFARWVNRKWIFKAIDYKDYIGDYTNKRNKASKILSSIFS